MGTINAHLDQPDSRRRISLWLSLHLRMPGEKMEFFKRGQEVQDPMSKQVLWMSKNPCSQQKQKNTPKN